jgi:hypothetical protein
MKPPIFDLVYYSWDSEKHRYFQGPEDATLEDFEEICDKLLPAAGYATALKRMDLKNVNMHLWITWISVVESLIPLLEKQGYQLFMPPQYEFEPTGVVGVNDYYSGMDKRLGFANKIIREYNHNLDQQIKKEREVQRKLMSKKVKVMPQIMK